MDNTNTFEMIDISTSSNILEYTYELEQQQPNIEMSSDTTANHIDTNGDVMNQSEADETNEEMSNSQKAQLKERNLPSPGGTEENVFILKG